MATSSTDVKTPKPRKLIMLIVVVALGLVATAAAAYSYLGDRPGQAEAPALPVNPIFVALEPFTVNLQPNGRSRFLHVGLTLKVADAASQGQVTQYLPEVRSRILTVLSNREADSLLIPEQKAQLISELLAALKQPFAPNLAPAKMSSVMFTTFILQ
ncbi:MAG: flagellar basal body-associated protein FliL [Burkholderiales bacterium RIFCSPHIGHO2_12_FULL_61_11]|nr:MAG: flagellar basal body-associated protein FliL [Burkholderiales bacterium RIFCSPHIGHO2_12_FULL_61_11]